MAPLFLYGLGTLLLTIGVYSQTDRCDYYQELQPNQSYYIYSPEYPTRYRPGSSCKWYAVSPPRTHVFLMCESFSIPSSTSCGADRLAVSKTGDLDLADAVNFCGDGGFTTFSAGNKMNIALTTSKFSRGGSFLCSIGVQENPTNNEEPVPDPGDCECGWKNPTRIVGGKETGVNEYPMMAGLIDAHRKDLFCGATIISPWYALTAAHCMINKNPREIGLLVGDHDTATGNDTNSANLLLINKIIRHPQYNPVTQVNDIAILRVDRPIDFNLRVGPVCLPFTNTRQSFNGATVDVLGWGSTDFGGLPSHKLQKVKLDVIPTSRCQKTYGNIVSGKQICTYKKGKDACQSDSGGPLLWEEPQTRRVKLLGVISYGIQCATENPAVNTRVTEYLPWIMQNADDEYCVK